MAGNSRYFDGTSSPYVEWMPTPEEIRERVQMVQWLRAHGFHVEPWATAIMIYETPSFALTQAVVARYGDEEARRKLANYVIGGNDA